MMKQKWTIEPVYVPRGRGNDANAGKRDLHYKIKEFGYVFPTKKDAEEYAETHELSNDGIIYAKKDKNPLHRKIAKDR